MELLTALKEFCDEISKGEIEVYNEASIQCELLCYLRSRLGNKYNIQLEINIEDFGLNKKDFLKKEMDVILFTPDKREKHCIELKFPRHGQYPEQMFSACRDVNFIEQLIKLGFNSSYFMMFTDDPLFYRNRRKSGIYKIFRDEKLIRGKIEKPTGKKDEVLYLDGEYKIEWQTLRNDFKYFIIEVDDSLRINTKISALSSIYGILRELDPQQIKAFEEAVERRPFFG